MTELADSKHWNSLYVARASDPRDFDGGQTWSYVSEALGAGRSARRLRRALGTRFAWLKPYDEFVLWEVLGPRYFPDGRNKTALEIGSAPGDYLVRLHQQLGYEPFGVEYSPAGVALNRRRFERAGIDPTNVIEADLFDETFQQKHRGRFDLVVSRGFIEHFSDPAQAAAIHLQLLKPAGTVVCSVPNLLGFNRQMTRLINSELLSIHNFDIMDRHALRSLFEGMGARTQFCGYYGGVNLLLSHASRESPRRCLMSSLMAAQLLLNGSFRVVFRGEGGESALFSPHLLYVGRKPSSVVAERPELCGEHNWAVL